MGEWLSATTRTRRGAEDWLRREERRAVKYGWTPHRRMEISRNGESVNSKRKRVCEVAK